jgi:hypothetical protein
VNIDRHDIVDIGQLQPRHLFPPASGLSARPPELVMLYNDLEGTPMTSAMGFLQVPWP